MKIRIKNPGFYDHDPAFPFLAVGTEDFVTDTWKHPWRDETIYWVRLKGKEERGQKTVAFLQRGVGFW